MAEDSGAFKTNPAKSRQIRHFLIAATPLQSSLTGRGNAVRPAELHSPRICNERRGEPCGILKPA
jgi:hypothetical protein